MKVGDILRITAPLRPESGKCYKIKKIYTSKHSSEQRYVTESGLDLHESVVESARTTEFKVDMVVKLNERGVEYGSTNKGLQLSKDSYARVLEVGEFHIKTQRVTPNNTLATTRYHRIHLDICPHMSYWYEADGVAETETLTFFEGPAKKPTVISAFKVGDKIRVNKPTENKAPSREDSMDKYDKNILTIKEITKLGYIFVKENLRAFHPDRCTPVVTETSGLEPYLPKPEPKFKVGDTVKIISTVNNCSHRMVGETFIVSEIITKSGNWYRETEGLKTGVHEDSLELVASPTPGRTHGVCTMYIDEAAQMTDELRHTLDNYMNKQTADLQGWQHQYLLSLSKTKPMTNTLKELRFEEFSKKTQKKLISITEVLEEYQQLTDEVGSVVGALNGRAAAFLNQFEKAYENQDKKTIETLLVNYEKFNKIIANTTILKALEDINAIENVPSVL